MASPNDDMLRTLREDIRNMNSNLQPEESVRGGIYRSQWTPSKTHMVPVWRQRPQDIQPEYPEPMRLNVGGRKFEVGRATLTESGYFRSLLSNKHSWSAQPDGSYFVDADPEIFEYLIRFMRRPSVYPLFWSKNDGFDYGLYHRVQVEAEHFEMPSLYEWIKNKTYVDAISVHTLKPVNEFVNTMGEKEKPGNYSEDCQVFQHVEKVYVCPRGVYVHRGRQDACGAACLKAQGDRPIEFEEVRSVQVTTVGRIVTFDETVCETDI